MNKRELNIINIFSSLSLLTYGGVNFNSYYKMDEYWPHMNGNSEHTDTESVIQYNYEDNCEIIQRQRPVSFDHGQNL